MRLARSGNRRDDRRFVWAVAGAAAALPVLLAWLALGFGGVWVTAAVDDLGALAVALLAGVGCLRRGATVEGRVRRGWQLLGLSALAWALGEVAWTYLELVAHRTDLFPSLADAGYLMAVPLALAAMFAFFEAPAGWTSRLRVLTDALIVGASVLYLSWLVVLGPLFHAGEGSLVAQVIGLAYPVGDVVILSAVVLVAARGRADADLPLGWIACGLVALAIADSGFAYLTQQGTYDTNVIDAGWHAGYAIIALAAVRPPASRGRADVRHELTLLPYLPVVAVLVIAGARAVGGLVPAGFLLYDGGALFVFVVVRQILTLRENRSLTCDLEAKVEARTLELSRSEERFRSLIQNVSDVISIVRPDGTMAYVSPSVENAYGFGPEDVLDRSIYDFLHPEDAPVLAEFLEARGVVSRRLEVRARNGAGDWRTVEVVGTDMTHDPALGGFVLTTRDVTERRRLEEQLAHQAFHDPLTGLANRALLMDRIGHGLARIGRTARDLAVIFIDVDDFKSVNDTLGHASGDELLREVGRRLGSCVRPGDTVARLGGDEFAVLMEEADEEVAVAVANRLQEAMAGPISLPAHEVHVSVSVGIARSGAETNAADEVVRNADVAMYQAKSRGKARHEIFRPEMHEALVQRVELLADLRRAVELDEFSLRYQPLVDLTTGRVVGFEALVRWEHPTRGTVAPVEFIPLAEETGLIVPLGRWILEEAVGRLREWDTHARSGEPLGMSVNLSVRQLESQDLIPTVADVLARSGIDPSRLTLELTESVLMEDFEETVTRLSELKALGVRIAIDDFGTGFSSLSYLQRLPVDSLKIDKSFVDDLGTPRGAELIRTVVDLGGALGLTTVAEGIEQPEQWLALQADGCVLGQGYVFARPLGDGAVESLLEADAPLPAAPSPVDTQGAIPEE